MGKPLPNDLPMMREIFVARTRDEAIKLAALSRGEVQGLSRMGTG